MVVLVQSEMERSGNSPPSRSRPRASFPRQGSNRDPFNVSNIGGNPSSTTPQIEDDLPVRVVQQVNVLTMDIPAGPSAFSGDVGEAPNSFQVPHYVFLRLPAAMRVL
jgi:hypothetical protein